MIYLLAINIVSLIIFGIDKLQAIRKKERIPEKILEMLIIIGGCFGSFLGMFLFHHKIRKIKFLIIISFSMIVWSILLYRGVVR